MIGKIFAWDLRFVLFNDTWFHEGHLVSCMTKLFLQLQIAKSDIKPQVKWTVSLLLQTAILIFLWSLCG